MIDTSLARRFLIQRDRAPIRLLSRPLLENVTIIDSRFRSSLLCLLFFSSCVCVCVRAFYISLGRSLGGPIYRGPFARPRAYSIRSQQRECIVVSSSFRLVVVLVLLSRSGHSRDSRIGCRVFFFFLFSLIYRAIVVDLRDRTSLESLSRAIFQQQFSTHRSCSPDRRPVISTKHRGTEKEKKRGEIRREKREEKRS